MYSSAGVDMGSPRMMHNNYLQQQSIYLDRSPRQVSQPYLQAASPRQIPSRITSSSAPIASSVNAASYYPRNVNALPMSSNSSNGSSSNYSYNNYNQIVQQQSNAYSQYANKQSQPQRPSERIFVLPDDAPANQYKTRAAAEYAQEKNIVSGKVELGNNEYQNFNSNSAYTGRRSNTYSSFRGTDEFYGNNYDVNQTSAAETRPRPSEAATIAAQNFVSGFKAPNVEFYQAPVPENRQREFDPVAHQQQLLQQELYHQELYHQPQPFQQQQPFQPQQQPFQPFRSQQLPFGGASPRAMYSSFAAPSATNAPAPAPLPVQVSQQFPVAGSNASFAGASPRRGVTPSYASQQALVGNSLSPRQIIGTQRQPQYLNKSYPGFQQQQQQQPQQGSYY